MFDPITLALIGGAVGGLMDKKDPLKGALLGAGIGATGGLLAAPTAGAAAGGAAAAEGAAGAGYIDALGGTYGADLAGASTSQIGLGSQLGYGAMKAGELIKPMGNVINTAAAAKNLMSSPETPLPQIQPSPVVTGQGGGQALAQLVTNNNQKSLQLQQENLAKKQRRMGLLGVA